MVKRIGMRRLAAFAAAAALVLGLVGCGGAQSTAQGNTEPVNLSVWTYYNGDQLESFNKLVDTFNNTVGKEKNITVESYSQGSVNDLETQVMAAAQGKVGASAMPNIFMAYADTAYAMDQMGELADLAPYFTDEERAAYVDSYLTEGDFDDSGSIKIFPVAKSTELLFLNDTDWKLFAAATGARYSDLETVEGLVKTAEAYYNWTDAQTDTPNDGKALFGRDAMANYMLIGAKELGETIFDDGLTAIYDRENHRYDLLPVKGGTILIDCSLCEEEASTGRLRFTCAHELGHWLLHKKQFSGTGENAALRSGNESDNTLEVQANLLGSILLLPLPQVKRCFYQLRSGRTNQQLVTDMAGIFQVSKQAMRIRLENHNLL